ncbi:MAG: hypothetical protein AB7K24_28835 [Gemmataceae bacterium]
MQPGTTPQSSDLIRIVSPRRPDWLPELGLGFALQGGKFYDCDGLWLRWRDWQGNLLPTAVERAEQDEERVQQERARAEPLAEKLRQAGIDPDA